MPKQQHWTYDIRTLNNGANRDLEDELVFLEDGSYIDACNFRVVSMGGDYAAAKKINGEELLYPNIDNRCNGGTGAALSANYECIGAAEINDHIIEFWADSASVEPSLIRIDGQIVLYSVDFPLTYNHLLQIAKNESCIGGEIYITDDNVPPMIFNIEDLMEKSAMINNGICSEKYFTEFNLAEHQLQVTNPIDHPVFIKLTSNQSGYNAVFGSGGLPVGTYSYQIRYSTTAGDKTIWSVPTPLIPVVSRLSAGCSPTFPNMQTHGKDPDTSSPSLYGIHLKFRVNNINNFDFMEIRRNSFNAGDPFGVLPVSELIGSINITNGLVGVFNILDNGSQAEESLSPDEAAESMGAIQKAKAIRYFNGKLYLMNIEYASRDVQDDITFVDAGPTSMFPIVEKIYKAGLKDAWKYTYNRPYMDGEKYGFAAVLYDDNNQFTYAVPITDFENFQMPDRRDVPSADTINHSYFGMSDAARIDGTIGESHEIFDLDDAVSKSDACSFLNILDTSGSGKSFGFDAYNVFELGCSPSGDVSTNSIGFKPLTPTSQNDFRCGGTDYVVNTWISNNMGLTRKEYNPQGFAPNYYSAGMALKGLESYPDWAKAFSIVRTAPAKRVVAQGIGYYSLTDDRSKDTNEFWFYSPDTDAGTSLEPGIVTDLMDNPQNYSVELVSPLGFFTEVYSSNFDLVRNSGVDLITYARIIKENANNPQMNPDEDPLRGITSGNDAYTCFGAWRAPISGTNIFPNGNATGLVGKTIMSVSDVTDNRTQYLKLRLSSNVYNTPSSIFTNGDNSFVRKWHEPLYIVNIVRRVADIADSNIQNYIHTGHYQKIESLVGISDGSNGQVFDLVDERWEDCMPSINGMVTNPYSGLFRFVHIDYGDEIKKRWINSSNLTIAQLTNIYAQLTASGVATIIEPVTLESFQVYGVYSQSQTTDSTAPVYRLNFQQLTATVSSVYFNPPATSKIYVLYDNRIPVRFFGGDVSQGEATCAFVDKQYDKNANPNGGQNEFELAVGFPNSLYNINDRYFIVNNTQFINKIQNFNTCFFSASDLGAFPSYIRQLTCMFACRSRADITYSFNDESTIHSSDQYFTLKNYVIRPYKWRDQQFANGAAAVYADNNIWLEYEDDYGNEFELWGYGGFRFIHNVNLDYSKDLTDGIAITSIPEVGFVEENDFCTRIAWSLPRPINTQNTPGLRTFLSQNYFDISDDTGEIKFAYDSLSGKGNNLYAFTQDGACLLLVDKRIISEINADELATAGSDIGGILGEYWLSKEIGMNDEFWRSAADYNNILYFANRQSAYSMADNNIRDIAKVKYHSKLYPDFLRDFAPGYDSKLCATYDVLHDEYWITFGKREPLDVEWCMVGGAYNLTDSEYFPNNPAFGYNCFTYNIGINANQTLNVLTRPLSNNTLILGGASATMLTESVQICSMENSATPLQIAYNDYSSSLPVSIVIATLAPGECICIDPVPTRGDEYTFVKRECTPFMDYDCPTVSYAQKLSQGNGGWNGSFDYKFDKYVYVGNKVYGMRNLETYELNKGYIINGDPIIGVLLSCMSNPPFIDKEFVRIRINSDNKPTAVQFFNTLTQALNDDVQAELDTTTNVLALKDYRGFEQYIPRKTAAPNNRMQGRIVIYKIIHNLEEDFKIVTVGLQYKPIK
jgi:hypothetical protein